MDHRRAADRAEHAVRRALTAADAVEPLDRAAVLAVLIGRLEAERERAAGLAAETGETFAAIGRAVGMSRQAARRRYRPQQPGGRSEVSS